MNDNKNPSDLEIHETLDVIKTNQEQIMIATTKILENQEIHSEKQDSQTEKLDDIKKSMKKHQNQTENEHKLMFDMVKFYFTKIFYEIKKPVYKVIAIISLIVGIASFVISIIPKSETSPQPTDVTVSTSETTIDEMDILTSTTTEPTSTSEPVKPPEKPITQGDGSIDNPFIITTEEELRKVGTDVDWGLDKYYRMETDIDLTGKAEWTAIGTKDNSFTGSFDGNNHVITGLRIDNPHEDNQGMFGYVNEAIIKNLGLRACLVSI